jgi:two-component system OmpR family sensor kinase
MWRRPSTWTLRAKLVASMLALFAVITMMSGAATVYALDRYLIGQVDQQLDSYFRRPPASDDGPAGDRGHGRGGPGNEGLQLVIADSGAVLVNFAAGLDNSRTALTADQIAQLAGSGLGRQATTINLGAGLGDYRVVAGRDQSNTATVIAGLPIGLQERTVTQLALLAGGGTLVGLVLVGLVGTWLVRRNLKPLDRVAATATRVARLPLDSGSVALADRVPREDTDTRTEVGKVGAALNEMLDHIDHALNARFRSEQRVRQFVADASHELRTPLASIRGYAELTRKEEEPVPANVTHALERVESEATRMSSLVDDLLLLARIDAGRPLDREPVDLSELVVNAVSDAHAASPGHLWQLDLPDEPVEVSGDRAHVHQIVANLLANARTHTPPGTAVRTQLAREGDGVRITVRDNGPGVPEELQPNVFQRFARGDTSRNRAAGSTGLGLSIVAAVAQAHGGTVEMESRPGDTCFSVLLPG